MLSAILLIVLITLNFNDCSSNFVAYSSISSSAINFYNITSTNNDCNDIWPELELFLPIHIGNNINTEINKINTKTNSNNNIYLYSTSWSS